MKKKLLIIISICVLVIGVSYIKDDKSVPFTGEENTYILVSQENKKYILEPHDDKSYAVSQVSNDTESILVSDDMENNLNIFCYNNKKEQIQALNYSSKEGSLKDIKEQENLVETEYEVKEENNSRKIIVHPSATKELTIESIPSKFEILDVSTLIK